METKTVLFNPTAEKKKKTVKTVKEKKERVVTQTKRWGKHMIDSDFSADTQLQLLKSFTENNTIELSEKEKLLKRQICDKIQGYKGQDIHKSLYDQEKFVDFSWVINKLVESSLICYYCKESMHVWYKHAREPKQWSLERIDNSIGHNKGNLEIACLSCNIRRKCMYHEKFRFTKQLVLTKVD
tara:strand:+ start:104 stop:652 length:549 start_codon:yes stop_codon:yes gene_type:complete